MTTLLVSLVIVAAAICVGAQPQYWWDYAGPLGPSTWAATFPNCDAARAQQSPIAVAASTSTFSAAEESFTWASTISGSSHFPHGVVANSRSTLSVSLWHAGIMIHAPETAQLLRLHSLSLFAPAEHTIDGLAKPPLELRYFLFPTNAPSGSNSSSIAPNATLDAERGARATSSSGVDDVGGVTISYLLDERAGSADDDGSHHRPSGGAVERMLWSLVNDDMEATLAGPVELRPFAFPPAGQAFRYVASLAEPPCRPNVTHYVLRAVLPIGAHVLRSLVRGIQRSSSATSLLVSPAAGGTSPIQVARPLQQRDVGTTTVVLTNRLSLPQPPAAAVAAPSKRFAETVTVLDEEPNHENDVLAYALIILILQVVALVMLVAYQLHEKQSFISDEREVWRNPITGSEIIGALTGDEDDEEDADGSAEEDEESDDEEDEEDGDDYDEDNEEE